MAKTALRPSPPPLEANDVAIVGGGTVLWFVGFLVLIPFKGSLEQHGHGSWPWICLTGAGLGLIGLWYCRARRDAIRRSRTSPVEGAGESATEGPATRLD
ncbi:DUF2530 domain-containing protein [Kitasatospora sp. NPDC101801]|uniref:DUF2530 domain-containing protein n=1 Tax=Kitasatospora sp. NPDC101801 TaxID=3364103 RepID=UPI003804D63F